MNKCKECKKLKKQLDILASEMRKQRRTLTAVYDRQAWELAEEMKVLQEELEND